MDRTLQYLLVALLCLFSSHLIQAQNNLTVSFDNPASVPDFLNICGDPDSEVVRISLVGSSPETRSNIIATAHLFEGVQFVRAITSDCRDRFQQGTGVGVLWVAE